MILAEQKGYTVSTPEGVLILYKPSFSFGIFEEVRSFLEEALAQSGEYTIESIFAACKQGTMHLWVLYEPSGVPQMAMVTGFIDYPLERHLHIYALGGRNLRRAWKFWPAVKTFMGFNDCFKLTAAVRPQFMRVLRRFGFAEIYSIAAIASMEKPSANFH